jgi:uncharacterized membrane protein
MEATLKEIAHHISLTIEVIAITAIAIGVIGAVIGIVRVTLHSADRTAVWMNFARWLVAGLTFQLAADVVNTSFDPSWDEIGHLGAIAVVRTFLSYFLDREMEAKATPERIAP